MNIRMMDPGPMHLTDVSDDDDIQIQATVISNGDGAARSRAYPTRKTNSKKQSRVPTIRGRRKIRAAEPDCDILID